MLLQINKKIFFYSTIFVILTSFNNKNFFEFAFSKKTQLEIIILNDPINKEIQKNLSTLKDKNLFLLQKNQISKIFNSDKTIEKFFVFKNYPSKLLIDVKKTKFIATTKKNGIDYYLGSNGNLIKANNIISDLPFLFGDVDIPEFFELMSIIKNSNFDFKEIKNMYYFKSKRWDIETKNGLLIKLPYENLDKSFELLSKILRKKNFDNIDKIYQIDLRQKNQLILNE